VLSGNWQIGSISEERAGRAIYNSTHGDERHSLLVQRSTVTQAGCR
jgi:hypothetical protein